MNIEQFRVFEKIKLCYLKHRGNILEISSELNLPLDYIKKMVHKFQKEEHRNVDVLIANNLMAHILLGAESRCLHLMEMLRSLEKTERPFVSVCCNAVFKTTHDSLIGTTHRCMSCKANCDIHQPPKATIYRIKLDLLEQLREEDSALVDMAEKMGYTNKVEAPTTVINHKPNVLVISDGSKQDQDIIEDYTKLSPMDRERLIEKLRKRIIEGESTPVVPESPEPPAPETPEVPPSTDPLQ